MIIYASTKNYHLNVNILGSQLKVQSQIEKPELYLLARCQSNDKQIMYSDTRMEDVVELSKPLPVDEIMIYDKLRFFKGTCEILFLHYAVNSSSSN